MPGLLDALPGVQPEPGAGGHGEGLAGSGLADEIVLSLRYAASPMRTPEVKLIPARPEHLDVWIAMRNGPTSRRLLPLDDDNREALLKRLREASSDVTA